MAMLGSKFRNLFAFALAAAGVAVAVARMGRSHAVRQAFQDWSEGEGSIYDLMDPDAEIVIAGTSAHCGTFRKDVFLRDVAGPFTARFSTPPRPRLRSLWASRDKVVVLADATGTTRDGDPYTNAYVFVFEMVANRVKRVTEFLDMAAFNAVWNGVEERPAEESAT